MIERQRVMRVKSQQLFKLLFVVTSVTLLCPGSASALPRKKSSSTKVSPPSYPEEEEPLIDQIAMESNDNAHQPPPIVGVGHAPPPVGYTGFKINPNCKCGESPYTSPGGNPHPWVAAIFYRNAGKESTTTPASPAIQYYSISPNSYKPSMLYFCTGVLINDRYLITASRCVQGLNATDLEVWLSDKSIWTDHDDPLRSLQNEANSHNQTLLKKIPVDKILIHPDFDPSVLDNEIALLRLADPVKLSRRRRDDDTGNLGSSSTPPTKRKFFTTPICLPKYDVLNSFLNTNERVEVQKNEEIGQNKSDNGQQSETKDGYIKDLSASVVSWDKNGRTSYSLVQVTVPVVKGIEKCSEMTNKTAVLSENMLCAGKMEDNAIQSCEMDTGSPLVIFEDGTPKSSQPHERIRLSSPASKGHYTLIGVSSWLYGCTNLKNVNILYDVIFPNNIAAKPQVPGVYTKVDRYREWITHNTLDAVWCS